MSIIAVADTHAFLWYLEADVRLSAAAKDVFERAAATQDQIAISGISLVETVFLAERGRVSLGQLARLHEALAGEEPLLVESPVNLAVAQAMMTIDRRQIPEMPDRIIAATARVLGVPVITRDHKIAAAEIESIW